MGLLNGESNIGSSKGSLQSLVNEWYLEVDLDVDEGNGKSSESGELW